MQEPWDVIVVGGRPAGASLAMRLGKRGRRVLVLERAILPSMPQVPTCPTLHMGALALLDELGVEEAAVAEGAVRFDALAMGFAGRFETRFAFPAVHGRAYGYSIDRRVFDRVMWQQLARFRSVTARQGVAVARVEHDERGRAVAVVARDGERFEGRWIVGADGRFSEVARQVGATVVEESAEQVSTVWFADWSGLAEDAVRIHATGKGLNVLFFPLPGRVTVCVHQRADRADAAGDVEAAYRKVLAGIPEVAARMGQAARVSRVVGMKRVGNGFRTPAGKGWALVGDALHFKDPVDGQGIYDALLASRILAEELDYALAGDRDEASTIALYADRVRRATHPMYRATCKRLADELYSEPPDVVIDTLIRWSMTDRAWQERFIRFLGREVEPDGWMPPTLLAGAALRGLGRDVAGWFGR